MEFSEYHPLINLLFFSVVIASTFTFNNPVYIAISYFSSFAYSVKLNKGKAVIFNILLVVFILIYTIIYAEYNHFGVTNLSENFVGNQITLEAVAFGFSRSVVVAAFIMWFSCINSIFTTDKILYMFAKISKKLSLCLSLILRTVPQIKVKFRDMCTSQKCIGKGIGQGSVFSKIKNTASVISAVTTWALENLIEKNKSMLNRGHLLKNKTRFSIYRFDNRDRSLLIFLALLITVLFAANSLEQTKILYNPRIVYFPPTIMSYLFYTVYLVFCLLPLILQTKNEKMFSKKLHNEL